MQDCGVQKVWEVCCIYQIQQKRFLGTVSRASPPNFNLFTTYLKSWLTSRNVENIQNRPRGKAYFGGCLLECAKFVGFFRVISSVL